MKRKLFCEISSVTYKVSVAKCILLRNVQDIVNKKNFAKSKQEDLLPVVIYKHNSLIRRTLGNVDMQLQENKAVNLSIAAPKINKVLIRSGEVFSFWKLFGKCTYKKGYKEGLTISNHHTSQDIGGGMCQFTNLIHWMILHSEMSIIEHHHHDNIDLFPDFNRQIPFGTGTSIYYNYVDYRFKNTSDMTYQLITYITDTHLCGELRAEKDQKYKYHILEKDEFFSEENGDIYRNGKIFRQTIDPITGINLNTELIKLNHAKVAYDTSNLKITTSIE